MSTCIFVLTYLGFCHWKCRRNFQKEGWSCDLRDLPRRTWYWEWQPLTFPWRTWVFAKWWGHPWLTFSNSGGPFPLGFFGGKCLTWWTEPQTVPQKIRSALRALASVPSTCCNKGMRTMSCVVQMPQQGRERRRPEGKGKPRWFSPPPPATSDSRKSQGTAKSDSAQPHGKDLAMAKKTQGEETYHWPSVICKWPPEERLVFSYKPKDAFLVLLLGILPFLSLDK